MLPSDFWLHHWLRPLAKKAAGAASRELLQLLERFDEVMCEPDSDAGHETERGDQPEAEERKASIQACVDVHEVHHRAEDCAGDEEEQLAGLARQRRGAADDERTNDAENSSDDDAGQGAEADELSAGHEIGGCCERSAEDCSEDGTETDDQTHLVSLLCAFQLLLLSRRKTVVQANSMTRMTHDFKPAEIT